MWWPLSAAHVYSQAGHNVVNTTSQPASGEGIPCIIQCVQKAWEHLFKALEIRSETWDSSLVDWFGRLHIAVAVALDLAFDLTLHIHLILAFLFALGVGTRVRIGIGQCTRAVRTVALEFAIGRTVTGLHICRLLLCRASGKEIWIQPFRSGECSLYRKYPSRACNYR